MKPNRKNLAIALAFVCYAAIATSACAQTIEKKTLKNVRGIDPAALVGGVCNGTFEVPGSRSNNGLGAFQIEFLEADGLLVVRHASRLGFVAHHDATNGHFVLDNSGPAATASVDGKKVSFVTMPGSKWDLVFNGTTVTGTVDPRGMPGREKWEVAQVNGKCKIPKPAAAPPK